MKKRSGLIYALTLVLLTVTSVMTACGPDKKSENEVLQDQLKAVSDSIIENTHIPGLVALVHDNKRGFDWFYAAGLADVKSGQKMDTSFVFRVGSNTKTMTGTILLQLVDEGKISLQDTLSKFFPDFPRANEVTIDMMCKMTSGIPGYSETDTFNVMLKNNPARVWTHDELIAIAAGQPYYFEPGSEWRYSNTNTILLGLIIEKLTGKTLKEEMENRIFKKLGLNNTYFIEKGTSFPEPHARGYYDGTFEEGKDVTEMYDVSWAWAAGGVCSTPRDLQKYCDALIGGGLISDSLQDLRVNHIPVLKEKVGYGICIFNRGTFKGHNGGIPGYTTSMYRSNDKDCTIIIYFNGQLEDFHCDHLFYRFVDILYGKDF